MNESGQNTGNLGTPNSSANAASGFAQFAAVPNGFQASLLNQPGWSETTSAPFSFALPMHSTSVQSSASSSSGDRFNTHLNHLPNRSIFSADSAPISKKRNKASDDVDDILGQICSKMNFLSTTENKNEELIQAFMNVLTCSREEAAFFLESSCWNIEDAVILYLDTNRGDFGKKHKTGNSSVEVFNSYAPTVVREYKRKQIFIKDLPDGWSAWVSRIHGGVYFVHDATGHMQTAVPPGFADIDYANGTETIDSMNSTAYADVVLQQFDEQDTAAVGVAVLSDAHPTPLSSFGPSTEVSEDLEVWGIMSKPESLANIGLASSTDDHVADIGGRVDSSKFKENWLGRSEDYMLPLVSPSVSSQFLSPSSQEPESTSDSTDNIGMSNI